MAQKTNKSACGTSFHGITVKATVNQLIQAFGEPTIQDNTGEDKVNFEWEMETEDGTVFTIYDWKEYRKLKLDEKIEWHIGSMEGLGSKIAFNEIMKSLK
jgi:hypothetical protein